MRPRVLSPDKFNEYMRSVDGTSYLDSYKRLAEFCEKRKQYYDSPVIHIPEWWSTVVLNCLIKMVAVDPALKIGRISGSGGKLRIFHSYCPQHKDKMNSLKLTAYNAIDRLILVKMKDLLENKNRVLI